MLRITRHNFLFWIVLVAIFFVGLVARYGNRRAAKILLGENAVINEFRNSPNFGAVERIQAYIADAYVWEKNAMPPNQELEDWSPNSK